VEAAAAFGVALRGQRGSMSQTTSPFITTTKEPTTSITRSRAGAAEAVVATLRINTHLPSNRRLCQNNLTRFTNLSAAPCPTPCLRPCFLAREEWEAGVVGAAAQGKHHPLPSVRVRTGKLSARKPCKRGKN
jgi:hypothetical protein